MSEDWIELSESISDEGWGTALRRDQIMAINEAKHGLCAIKIEGRESLIFLAGEYDIVRDEITRGKWSTYKHRIGKAPSLFDLVGDTFSFTKYKPEEVDALEKNT